MTMAARICQIMALMPHPFTKVRYLEYGHQTRAIDSLTMN